MSKKQSKPPSYNTVDVLVLVGVAVVALIVFRFHDGAETAKVAHAEAVTQSAPSLVPEPPSPEPQSTADSPPEAVPSPVGQEPPPASDQAEQEPPPASDQADLKCKPRCLPPWKCVRGTCMKDEAPAPDTVAQPPASQPAEATAATHQIESAPSKTEQQGRCAPGQTECSDAGCVDLMSNAANCGECGFSCSTLHQVGTRCVGGRCLGSGCLPGWGNCDDMSGCETNLKSPEHCGSCFNACNWYTVGDQRKRGQCVGGKCVPPKFN